MLKENVDMVKQIDKDRKFSKYIKWVSVIVVVILAVLCVCWSILWYDVKKDTEWKTSS